MTYSLLFKFNSQPWNKGMIIGPKPPLKLKEVWAIRVRLQLSGDVRNLALFNTAIDSKLRACDLVALRVCDVTQGYKVVRRATVMQRKIKRPVQFEISDQTRLAIRNLITHFSLTPSRFLFPSRMSSSPHLSTRQYAKIVKDWVSDIRFGPICIWNTLVAENQGNFDLSTDKEPSGCPVIARTYQIGEHRTIFGN